MRKVRYRADVCSVLKFIVENNGKYFSQEPLRQEVRRYLLEGRRFTESLFRKHFRKGRRAPSAKSRTYTETLSVTIPDTLIFFRRIGLLQMTAGTNGIIVSNPRLEELYNRILSNDPQGDISFVACVFESTYRAYFCFLLRLLQHQRLVIKRDQTGRGPRVTSLLGDYGFLTDVASFYTIRDLFYEFGICNWNVNRQGDEAVFPTCQMSTSESPDFRLYFKLSNGFILSMERKVSPNDFAQVLCQSYLMQTHNRYGVDADLMSVRDATCERMGISDQQFRRLIVDLANRQVFNISLSFGRVTFQSPSYMIKMTNLPIVSPNQLGVYLRMDRSD